MSALKTEHPDWVAPKDFDLDKLKAEGFEDISYRLDDFPFFGNFAKGYTLAVDYPTSKSYHYDSDVNFKHYHLFQRELAEGETEHECLHDDAEHILSTDKFQDVLDHLEGKGADHAESEASGTAYDCVSDRLSLIQERPVGERDKEEEATLERCLKWLNT